MPGSLVDMTKDPDETRAPDDPTDLPKRSWFATLKRTFREFKEDNLTDWAAALTYYAVLSIFPALIALVSMVGLIADPATITRVLTDTVSQLGPASAIDTFKGPIESITASESRARLGLRRRLHARVQLDLRDRGGPPVLQAAAAADPRDADPRADARDRGRGADRQRPAGHGDRRGGRARRHRADGLQHRQVARAARDRLADAGDPLLRGAQREAARLQVDLARQRAGRRGLDPGLGRLRVLRLQVRLLRQDLRHARRRDHLP